MNAYYNNIASRIEVLYNSGTLKELCYTPAGTELMQIYNDLTGNNSCNTCANTMYPILLEFKKNYHNLIEKKMSKILVKYRFKDGLSYSFFGSGTVWTNQNLTDEIAEMIIEAHTGNIDLFDTFEFVVEEVKKEFLADAPKEEETPAEEVPKEEETPITEEETPKEGKAKAKK